MRKWSVILSFGNLQGFLNCFTSFLIYFVCRRFQKNDGYAIPIAIIVVDVSPPKDQYEIFIHDPSQIAGQSTYEYTRNAILHLPKMKPGFYHVICSCYKSPTIAPLPFFLNVYTTATSSNISLSSNDNLLSRPSCEDCGLTITFPFVTVAKSHGNEEEDTTSGGGDGFLFFFFYLI